MTKLAEQVHSVLASYVGDRMAGAIARAAAAESRVDFDELTLAQLPKLLDVVDRHLGLSIHDAQKRQQCMRDLRHSGPNHAPTPSVDALMIIPILREEDVMRVRGVILKLTRAGGFPEDRQPAVVAAVAGLASELLARGLRGTLVFRKVGSPPGLEITAFEGTKAPPGRELSTIQVKADEVEGTSQANMGTTIRAVWYRDRRS